MKLAKKGILLLTVATFGAAAVYIVSNIIGSLRCFTSFPWWSAFVFGGIYFGPVLLLEIAVYGVLVLLEKKT